MVSVFVFGVWCFFFCCFFFFVVGLCGGMQETIERDLEKLGNVLKMRERSMLYSMKLETKLGRLSQMLEVGAARPLFPGLLYRERRGAGLQ